MAPFSSDGVVFSVLGGKPLAPRANPEWKPGNFKLHFEMPGHGSSFPECISARRLREQPLAVQSILLLEDDEVLRETIEEVLDENDYRVVAVGSSQAALTAAQQQQFHLILSDVRMAGELDGVDTIAAIKKRQPQLRSIVMTGYADLDVPIKAARIQADDYLRKPFKLTVLLQTLRSVLERETPFRGLFSRLGSKAARWLYDAHLEKLNDIRRLCLQRLFLLMRSGRRSAEEVYPLFCALEVLELEYLRQDQPQQWKALSQRYQVLEEGCLGEGFQHAPSTTLTMPLFRQLYSKVQDGRVESVHLQRAFPLLHSDQARRQNLESYSTFHWLWSEGAGNADQDPFLGLQLEGHQLHTLRSSPTPRARLYDTPRGDVILCLPADDESRVFLQNESHHLLKEAYGHLFLFFAGESLSLKRHIPAEGLSPKATWDLLRPVFLEVLQHHQQGRCSGSFSLRDIEKWPGQPAKLREFSPRRFLERRRAILQNHAIALHYPCAPEAARQEQPTPASDQYVLGVLLGQVLQAGLLADIRQRMTRAEPAERYPDLRQAGQALTLAVQHSGC